MLSREEAAQLIQKRAERMADHLELDRSMTPRVARHLHELAAGKTPIFWLQGQNCTGCSVSLLNSEHFNPVNLHYDRISLIYQPDLTPATGDRATGFIEEMRARAAGRYILVVEGSVPTGGSARFCTYGLGEASVFLGGMAVPAERTMQSWLEEMVPQAEAVICVGNCAAYGGIPAEAAGVTGATAVPELVSGIDETRAVINVAGCPPHPDWIMGTIVDTLLWKDGEKEAPHLDELGRDMRFYGKLVHDTCERRTAFEEKRFLTDWNQAWGAGDLCMLKMGCRGPRTRGDCPTRLWNSYVNWCVGANAPCQGCTDPGFHRKLPHFK